MNCTPLASLAITRWPMWWPPPVIFKVIIRASLNHPPSLPSPPPPNPQTSVRTGGRCSSGSIGSGFFVSGGRGGGMGVGLDHDERAGQIVGAALIRGEGGVKGG